MKFLQILFIALCFLFNLRAQAAHQLYADMDGISIPYGTKINLQMAQNVTNQMNGQMNQMNNMSNNVGFGNDFNQQQPMNQMNNMKIQPNQIQQQQTLQDY